MQLINELIRVYSDWGACAQGERLCAGGECLCAGGRLHTEARLLVWLPGEDFSFGY